MTDFGVIATFMHAYLSTISTGYTNIQPSVNYIMAFMITLTIVLTAGLTWIWGDWETMIRGLVSRILLIGFILLLVEHWENYTDIVGYGLTELGLKASGSVTTATSFLQDPTTIIETGYNLFSQLMKTANSFPTGVTGLGNFVNITIYGIAAILVFMAYLVIALQVLVTFLEFKIINLAALVLVPFAIWQKTTFLSDRAIGYMFSAGLKLFVLALVVSIGVTFTSQFDVDPTPDFANALAILSGSIMLVALSIFVPRLAQALISGGPQLGAAEAAIGAGAAAAIVGGAAYYGSKASSAITATRSEGTSSAFGQMKAAAQGGTDGIPATAGGGNSTLAKAAGAFQQGSGSGAGFSANQGSGSDIEEGT